MIRWSRSLSKGLLNRILSSTEPENVYLHDKHSYTDISRSFYAMKCNFQKHNFKINVHSYYFGTKNRVKSKWNYISIRSDIYSLIDITDLPLNIQGNWL